MGVVTVKQGWAVQSIGYSKYLPLGHPECLVENLDRWGADEIVVLSIDRSRHGLGPDLTLLRRLGALGLSTPLTYGGGIRSVEDAGAVVKLGADRVCVDAILRPQPDTVRGIAELLGAQAVIGVLPISVVNGVPLWRDYLAQRDEPLETVDLSLFVEQVISEVLVVDWRHEGTPGGFDVDLVRTFPLQDIPIIAFGGLSEASQLADLFADERIVACGIGNFLSYREHAVQQIKRVMSELPVRPPEFMVEL